MKENNNNKIYQNYKNAPENADVIAKGSEINNSLLTELLPQLLAISKGFDLCFCHTIIFALVF